jgi:hypothetical protein
VPYEINGCMGLWVLSSWFFVGFKCTSWFQCTSLGSVFWDRRLDQKLGPNRRLNCIQSVCSEPCKQGIDYLGVRRVLWRSGVADSSL